MYERLTAFLPRLELEKCGEWIIDKKNDGSPEHPIQFPYVNYDRTIDEFVDNVYCFIRENPEMDMKDYNEILEQSNIQWSSDSMVNANEAFLDGKTVVALIFGAIRAERFCDGALMEFCENGCIQKWLKRLKVIDDLEKVAR